MKRCVLFFLAPTLAACVTSSPDMFGATRGQVSLGGIDFTVFVKADRAEVVRHGYLRRAERDRVPPLMEAAVEQVSGCRVRPGSVTTGLPGDTGVARMRLDC